MRSLTELTKALDGLRDRSEVDQVQGIRELENDLLEVVSEDRITTETRINLLTKATRVLDPKAPRKESVPEAVVAYHHVVSKALAWLELRRQ